MGPAAEWREGSSGQTPALEARTWVEDGGGTRGWPAWPGEHWTSKGGPGRGDTSRLVPAVGLSTGLGLGGHRQHRPAPSSAAGPHSELRQEEGKASARQTLP